MALTDASSYYYGAGDAMDRVLEKMQEGINLAAEAYDAVVGEYEDPHVAFALTGTTTAFPLPNMAGRSAHCPRTARSFSPMNVGEPMAEALVLMQMMEDSHQSTGVVQATNNWSEGLNVERFGKFTMNVDISDSWGHIDY